MHPLLPLALVVLAASPAAAQTRVGAEAPVQRTIAPVYVMNPGVEYPERLHREVWNHKGPFGDLWIYFGVAGERVTVTMRSRDFVPALTVDAMRGEGTERLAAHQAGAGEGESRVTLTLPYDGEYFVSAAAARPAGAGDYTLRLDSEPPPPP